MNCRIFSRLLIASVRVTFSKIQVKVNFVFRQFHLFLSFRTQSAKKRVCVLPYSQWKLWIVFEIVLKRCVCTKIVLIKKNISKEKIRRHVFVVYVLIEPLPKFGGNRTDSLSFSSLQCPLQVKELIRENSAKYVNRTGG